MTDDREPRARDPRAISGGSLQEAELQAAPDVAWRATAARSESPFEQGVRRLRRSTTALIGAAIVAVLLVVALFADVLAPQSPITSDQTHTFERPSWDYPLGTDQLGRDMLSRIIHGSRISLAVGVSSVLLALFVGEENRGHPDRQGDPAAVDDAAQHVAPELVRSEGIVPARALEGVGLVAGDRALGREHVREEGDHEQHGDDGRADEGRRATPEPAHALLEWRLRAGGRRPPGDVRGRLELGLLETASADGPGIPGARLAVVGHRVLRNTGSVDPGRCT